MVPFPLLCWALAAQAADPAGLANGGFEEGTAGETPPGWTVSDGGDVATTLEAAAEGRQAVRLRAGRLSQTWRAAELAGRRVAVQVQAQGEPDTVGQVSLRAHAGGTTVWSDRLHVDAPAWETVTLQADLPATADLELELSVKAVSGEALLLDAVSLSDLGPVPPVTAAPLADDAAVRMAAFARLYSHARWFHPADGVLDADWDRIALEGVALAEQTTDPAALAAGWQELLQPVAPTVQVWSGTAAPPPLPRPPGDRQVAWHHEGAGVGLARRDPASVAQPTEVGNAFRRFRVDSVGGQWPEVARTVHLAELDARAWREETVRLTAAATIEGDLDAFVVLSTTDGARRATTPSLRSGVGELLLEVPSNADTVTVHLELTGRGSVEITALEAAAARPTPARLLAVRSGMVATYSALIGALALAGAALTRRTIGGFLLTGVALLGTAQVIGVDPTLAMTLPNLHVQNLEAWLIEDARLVARSTEGFGRAVAPGVSAAVVMAWIGGLLGAAMLRLRGLDIRGGGD